MEHLILMEYKSIIESKHRKFVKICILDFSKMTLYRFLNDIAVILLIDRSIYINMIDNAGLNLKEKTCKVM